MVTIDKIDFSKLKPYDGKVTKCFEQLCYQIAQNEYSHLGVFTPIDGSGGDGGVEFYLKLFNGEKWGWQCKFYGDSGRLNTSSRNTSIEESLETACRNHADLTKWILCLKTDLTTDSLSSTGKFSNGEKSWFENELPKKIPTGKSVLLEHWGESSFITFLKETKNIGIRNFFFGELEFTETWFRNKFQENFEKVKDKYDPDLHSIDTYTQAKVDFVLFNRNNIGRLVNLENDLRKRKDEINEKLKGFVEERMIDAKEIEDRKKFVLECEEFDKHTQLVYDKINFLKNCFVSFSEDQIDKFNSIELKDNFINCRKKINYAVFDSDSRAFRDASKITRLMSSFAEEHLTFFSNFFHKAEKELHFIADAAKGKTHLSCDIAYKNISDNIPALFITGDKFTDETSIIEAFKKVFDINSSFTFDDFIQALSIYGSILKVKIPIIIDGLNETTFNRLFSPIWKNHLGSLASKISQTKNIVLITTCRSSYAKRIWNDINDKKFYRLNGFDDYETIREAVDKYFRKYKIKADLLFASLDKFQDPIFLKIYCEIKSSNRKTENEVEVNIEEESTFDIFTEYLRQINIKVTNNNHLFKENEQFISASLKLLSQYLWNNNLREIPVEVFYNLIDNNKEYVKDHSKAEVLVHEGLVVARDIRENQEYVSFTYDILAGYMIAQHLIQIHSSLNYFKSKTFINQIIQEDRQHPLYEDIISALCMLLPEVKHTSYFTILKSDMWRPFLKSNFFKKLPDFIRNRFASRIKFATYTSRKSVEALFSLQPQFVSESDTKTIEDIFKQSPQARTILFDLSFKLLTNTKHSLNSLFFTRLLTEMKMNGRDISWTEYIRRKAQVLYDLLDQFENQFKSNYKTSSITIKKQHLVAKIIVWFLTSTNRNLRDKSTRALYYYGRKFPEDFSKLLYNSLSVNDPYVWERMLAAMYGVAMAEHNSLANLSFRTTILPTISKKLYQLIFKEDALYSTTHILARDYARRTIEICLIHHPNLLSNDEIKNIKPPYSFGGLRTLGEVNYKEEEHESSGPIQMDFSNYTIGRIVKDGHSYSNPPEKIKVRNQIYWRLSDLGWSEELFDEVERDLGNETYYNRSERAKIERYGKKYSWIAFFENAGLRADQSLLDDDWEDFRLSDADIDPSFPVSPENIKFVTEDLLGDRSTSLIDWYKNGGMPYLEEYLSLNNPNGTSGEWICLDGFIVQEDVQSHRQRFAFIRSCIIDEKEYSDFITLLQKQNLGGRWFPEIRENHYTFAGEMIYCEDSTEDNYVEVGFTIAKRKVVIKKGEPGYFPHVFIDYEDENPVIKEELPNEITRELSDVKEFKVLLPVMEYAWESYHSELNEAGVGVVVSKEIASYLNLKDHPQTFELFEESGTKASLFLKYHSNFNNNHRFVYLRKDLLQKYLEENHLKFVQVIWGEREVSFQSHDGRDEFFKLNPFERHQVFQKVTEYAG